MKDEKTSYQCKICKLHYSEKEYADECYKWCSENESCNLEITKHSLEVKGGKK